MPNSTENKAYTKVAIFLHWLIATAIIGQIIAGLWMVDAIRVKDTQKIAYDVYQWHKAIGLTILTLSLLRLVWRLTHKAPAYPKHMTKFEKFAAHSSHSLFYIFMISIPLAGWAMVSVSIYGLPTMYFDLFEWPHIPFLVTLENKTDLEPIFKEIHEYLAFGTIGLLILHVGAALKHHYIDKDNVLKRMIPFLKVRS